jgi:hypothetical protein
MNNMCELTPFSNKSLYPVLQHYIGSPVTEVFLSDEVINFVTFFGDRGKILEEVNGDWKILIGKEIVDIIEKDVFLILTEDSQDRMLEDYWEKLNELINLNLRCRSKILINSILSILKEYIIYSDFKPKRPMKVGPFLVENIMEKKTIICLN